MGQKDPPRRAELGRAELGRAEFPEGWKPTPETVPDGYHVFRDEDEWLAVGEGHENLQASPVGVGETPEAALEELREQETIEDARPARPPGMPHHQA